MKIREATERDSEQLRQLHCDAFGADEGPVVAELVSKLLADESAKPLLCLVAEDGDAITGSILFSTVKVTGSEGIMAYILAPLAVAPTLQRQGIGRALIERGFQHLQAQGAELICVLGDHRYYGRYGFSHHHLIVPPHRPPYREAWMAIGLNGRALESVRGQLVCADSLGAPEYW